MARIAYGERKRVDMRLDVKEISFLDAIASHSVYHCTRTAALEEVLDLVRGLAAVDFDIHQLEPLAWKTANLKRSMEKITKAMNHGTQVR